MIFPAEPERRNEDLSKKKPKSPTLDCSKLFEKGGSKTKSSAAMTERREEDEDEEEDDEFSLSIELETMLETRPVVEQGGDVDTESKQGAPDYDMQLKIKAFHFKSGISEEVAKAEEKEGNDQK